MENMTKQERIDYFEELSLDYGVPLYIVEMLADLLGPNEDFDGLVTELEDYCGDWGF